MSMYVNMVLQMYSMIACLRLKSDLGGGESPNSFRNTGGGVNRNVTFCYIGEEGGQK